MSRVLPDLIDEIRTQVLLALPDLAGQLDTNGIWSVTHIDRVPFEKLAVPYAVIECDRQEGQNVSGDYGLANDAYLIPVNLSLVLEQKWDAWDLMGYLEDLRDYFAQY